MTYIVKDSGSFTPAPAGLHRAVCVDVVDVGVMQGPFGAKEKVRLVWEIEEPMESGKPFLASQLYTPSLHEKANLRLHLESWRCRTFTPKELAGFDLEVVIGVCCQLQIQHNTKNGRTYANIIAIVPLSKGQEKLKPTGEYVRVKDRAETPEPEHNDGSDEVYDDEGVPF